MVKPGYPQWTLHVEMAFKLLTVGEKDCVLHFKAPKDGVCLLVEHSRVACEDLGSITRTTEGSKQSKSQDKNPFSYIENQIGVLFCRICAPPPPCSTQAHFAECSSGALTLISLMLASCKSRRRRFPKFLGASF